MKKLFFLILTLFVSSVLPGRLWAAQLYFSAPVKEVQIGNLVTVELWVNTEGQAINNASAQLSWPVDILEPLSISKAGSIFSMWIEEPKLNAVGLASFDGGLPNPGFNGAAGKLVSLTFRAKKAGIANLSFLEAAVRVNDGLGTDALRAKPSLALTVVAAAPTPIPETPATSDLLKALTIKSSTHPDQDRWYSNSAPAFTWSLPEAVTRVQTVFSRHEQATPSVTYDTPLEAKQVDEVADGIGYFHLRYEQGGAWSEIASYRVMIDTVPPVLSELSFANRIDEAEAQTLIWQASDELSGLSHYLVAVDDQRPKRLPLAEAGPVAYTLPSLSGGEHLITVTAFDLADNSSVATTTIQTKASVMVPALTTTPSPSFGDRLASLLNRLPPRLPFWILIISGLVLLLGMAIRFALLSWLGRQVRRLAARSNGEMPKPPLSLISLRKTMENQIIMLERADLSRRLTPEEEKIRRQLKRWVKTLRDS